MPSNSVIALLCLSNVNLAILLLEESTGQLQENWTTYGMLLFGIINNMYDRFSGKRCGLMVSALDSRSSGPGSSPGMVEWPESLGCVLSLSLVFLFTQDYPDKHPRVRLPPGKIYFIIIVQPGVNGYQRIVRAT